ncbi:hypothetical protein JZ751_023126 [Albula glossodonta]|uniref:Rho-GAP domain-containing protein n=1 Tax=Albula glossodonta TaxID=121402 RepID=A0A8T2PH66_9TELE|nr:hypothetical protein JZ751_023126 [Albula glossodonta]
MGGAVPRFLVDACEFLSLHLHTEGLFRKTGSLSRIRALRPCDVASLLKQFLRELPSPLIPLELQGALCRAQGLGPDARDGATLLVTALFPPSHARTLRYLCTFLRRAAQRCSENRMEVGSLALVMAPNLLQGPASGCKLTVGTERLLDRQAAVITALITHADRIGVIPSIVTETLSGGATPSAEGVGFQERAGLSVYRSLRRQRRRSVGEMFVDAFSKLKTGRTPTGLSCPSDGTVGQQVAVSPTPLSPIATKRKASEDTVPEVLGSAKKRRSVHDVREDSQPPALSCSDESESNLSQSPTPSLCSVISGVGASEEQEPQPAPLTTPGKKRNHARGTKRVQRLPALEDRARRRRRSLRFFTMTSWSNTSTVLSDDHEADNWLLGTKQMTDNPEEPASGEGSGLFQAPIILIDGPGGVVVGREVEDDPDILNCSFVESPCTVSSTSTRRIWSVAQLEDTESAGRTKNGARDCQPGKGGAGTGAEQLGDEREVSVQPECLEKESEVCVNSGEDWPAIDIFRRVSHGYRPPRRSISLPEVSSEQAGAQEVEEGVEEEDGEVGGVGAELCDSDLNRGTWAVLNHTETDGNGTDQNGAGLEKEIGAGGEGEEEEERECKGRDRGKEMGRDRKERREEKRRVAREGVEKEGEATGLGFTRSHQRMSVVDRMRRFNLLSAWLRAPRPPPVPPAPQRGPVRLRRQGARRFSRSISHEGVTALLQEPSTLRLQTESQEPPKQRKLRIHSPNPLNSPLCYLSSNPQNHLNPPLNNPSSDLLSPPRPLNYPSLLSPPNQPSTQLTPQNYPPSQALPPKSRGGQDSPCNHLQKPQPVQEPGRPRRQSELQREWEAQLPSEMDLHELLHLQLRIQPLQPDQEPPACQRELGLSSPPPLPQQGLLTPPTPPRHLTAPATNPSSFTGQTEPTEADKCINPAPKNDTGNGLAPDGLNESGASEADGDGVPSLSPLALPSRAPATRRRYRDSPRWPIPEIHITTMTPFQL